MRAVALATSLGTSAVAAEPAKTVQYLAQTFVIPHFKAVHDAALKQEVAWDTFCNDRVRGDAGTLRLEYNNVADAWAKIEFVRIGPAAAELRAERFNFWLDRRDAAGHALDALMSSSDPKVLDEASISAGSAAAQGEPMLERLLYDEAALARLEARGADKDRRCAIGKAMAHSLVVISQAIATDWSKPDGAGAAIMSNKAWGPHFVNANQAASVMVTDLVGGLEVLKDFKVPMMFHDIANKGAIRLAEGARSGRSLRDVRLNFSGIREALGAFLASATAQQRTQLDQAFGAAEAKLDAIAAAGKRADKAQQLAAIQAAIDSLASLKEVAMTVIPAATGVSLGFNNLDGD